MWFEMFFYFIRHTLVQWVGCIRIQE